MSDSEVVSTAPATEVPAEATLTPASIETPAVGTTPETVIETPKEPPKPLTAEELQKRFDRDAAAQRRRYERDLQSEREARIRLEEQVKHLRPVPDSGKDAEPQLKDFENFDEYVTAKARFIAAAEIKATLARNGEATEAERAQAAQRHSAESWNKQLMEFVKEVPDFHDIVDGSQAPISMAMKQAIDESSNSPKLVHYLATHLEEAEKIAAMTPIGAVRALTLIEEGFKKPVAVTKAAPPITPTGSRSTAVKSLLDITTQAEFEKRRREFRANRH